MSVQPSQFDIYIDKRPLRIAFLIEDASSDSQFSGNTRLIWADAASCSTYTV
jgi:hypothetical protein